MIPCRSPDSKSAENILERGVFLDKRLPADVVALDDRVEDDDPAGAKRRELTNSLTNVLTKSLQKVYHFQP